MMYNLAITAFLLVSSLSSGLSQTFLSGTWKIEGKEQYEVWTRNTDNSLSGYSYKIKGTEKVMLETLSINNENGQVIYSATVPNQNDGKTIAFTLNPKVTDKLSFENLNHDFPKKIQYTLLNGNELFVQVLGENDQGFSYKMIKQLN